MAPLALFLIALVASFALATSASNTSTSSNTYGTGGSAPSGWDASVQNFCTTPQVLKCCNGTSTAGAAADAASATATGCVAAMAGGQITNEFGYCPFDYQPLCCAVLVAAGIYNGCGPPTQVNDPNSGSTDSGSSGRIFQSNAEVNTEWTLVGLSLYFTVNTTVRW